MSDDHFYKGLNQVDNHSSKQNDMVSQTLYILSKLVHQVEDNVSEEDENIALDCFIKLFNQVPLSEHMDILLFVTSLLQKTSHEVNVEMQCKLCDALSTLVFGNVAGVKEKFGRWKEIVTNVLTGKVINIFGALQKMLTMDRDDVTMELRNRKMISCLKFMTGIIDSNAYILRFFHEEFGVHQLKTIMAPHHNLIEDIAYALLDLLTVSNYPNIERTKKVIHIEELTPVLVDLVPNFNEIGQRAICETIRVMCASCLQNRLICCQIGLLTNILTLLGSCDSLSKVIMDCLISIMEILGCLSITSCELKLLISLFNDRIQFSHADRMVQSLERMASQSSQYHMHQQPKYFIDLYNAYLLTSIQCPRIQKFNGKGISVHMWICLNFTLPNPVEHRQSKIRHVLYSFLNSQGEGFEAFFTEVGYLVLSVHTKKQFLTTTVSSAAFDDQEWHGLTIVHTKKLLGRATIHVYVDGNEIHSAQLQYPSLSKEITFSSIGCGVKSHPTFHYQIHPQNTVLPSAEQINVIKNTECIVAGQQNQVWGIPSSLKGQISSFIMFNDSLSLEKINELIALGPNFQHLFTPKELLPEISHSDTAGLLSSVVFYFNAKAALNRELIDLNNTFHDKLIPKKNLTGKICKVWTIQEAIQSLGGLPLLFPLLEQACFKTNKNRRDEITVIEEAEEKEHVEHLTTSNNKGGTNVCEKNNQQDLDSVDVNRYIIEVTKTSNDIVGGPTMNLEDKIAVDGLLCSNRLEPRDNSDCKHLTNQDNSKNKTTVIERDNVGDLSSQDNAESLSEQDQIEDLDEVDGRSVVLSDLPVAYSPRKPYIQHYDENDPSTWDADLDEELIRIEVVEKNMDFTDTDKSYTDGNSIVQNRVVDEKRMNNTSSDSLGLNNEDSPPRAKERSLTEWTIVDPQIPRTRSDTYKRWARQGDNHDLNGVAHFIALMRYMISSRKQVHVTSLDVQGIKVISLLLHGCDPGLLNIGFLESVARLVESLLGVKDDMLEAVFRHIVFDFEIWSKADISVQIAHTQLLHNYIKDEPDYFGQLFTVDYFLQVVEQYYCSSLSVVSSNRQLSESNERDLRKALLGLIFFMLKSSLTEENMNFIIDFISAVSKNEHLNEVLDLLHNAVKTGGHAFNSSLSESGSNILYRWLVHDISNETRLKILAIMNFLLQHGKLSDAGRKKLLLKEGLIEGIGELLNRQDVSRKVIINFLKLGTSYDRSAELKSEIYTDFSIVLIVFKIVQFQPRPVKLEVAIKVRSSLKLSETSASRCADEVGWYEPIWKIILSENSLPEDENVMKTELVQVVIEIIHIVMWTGIIGSDLSAWTRRSEPLSCLHQISSQSSFVIPALCIERQLLEMCLKASVTAVSHSSHQYAVVSQNAVQLLKIIEEFLISTEISNQESMKWSTQLIDNIFMLLDALSAWDDSTEGGNEWVEVLQIVERILYHSFMQSDKQLLEKCSKKLSFLLNKRVVTSEEEATYQIYNLDKVVRILQAHELPYESIIIIILQLFERFCSVFIAKQMIPNLPSLRPSVFKKEFVEYMNTEEYVEFHTHIRDPADEFQKKVVPQKSSVLKYDKLWLESLNAVTNSIKHRQERLEESLENVAKIVYSEFDERRQKERTSLEDHKKIYRQKNAMTRKLWQYQKRFLKSERGAWKSKTIGEKHFRLSNTENCYRMRLKLTENLKYNPHTDASHQRDIANAPDVVVRETVNVPRMENNTDEGVFSDEELLSPNEDEENEEKGKELDSSHLYNLETFDDVSGSCIYSSEAQLVTLMDIVPGRIELTSTHVCFYDDNVNEMDSSYDFKFSLNELREVYSRRYNLRKTAMEFFLLDRTSYFVNFPTSKEKETFYRKLAGQRPKNLYYSGIQNPYQLLRVSKLTSKWVEREISNFEYLMQLNTISGRTYNDLAQYPIFPWVLTDYDSSELNLEDESIYRDLSKPCGALKEKNAIEIQKRYESFIDVSGLTEKSHYFTHYSNPGGILHYLVRVEPFTSLHIGLQSGKFDCADRQFYSIATTWSTIYNGGDVKELIPEFFCFPEFLINMNRFNLGTLQRTKKKVDDVLLPPWASDAYEFIDIHRRALESEYVSANLHSWIDLIFGYKQRGKAAEKALNVFSHYTYEGAVDVDKIVDPVERAATEGMINNFGQTPTQLLKRPHPKRKTLQEVDSGKMKAIDNLDNTTYSLIEIRPMKMPVVFIAVCKPRPKSILYNAVPDSLVTVYSNGLFGIHQWLPHAGNKSNTFTFTMDVLLGSISSHHQRVLPGSMSPTVEYSSKLFAFTSDGHLMLSCGYWDNSIRLIKTVRGKDRLTACVTYHNDIVTCISLDFDGSHLISGSADLTCAVWKIEQSSGFSSGLSKQPVQVLYGHTACVSAVAMFGDLDLAVSGANDGTCLVHTIRRGIFMHTLTPRHPNEKEHETTILQIKLSEQGKIVILSKLKDWDMPRHFITVYSINGVQLSDIALNLVVHDICVTNEHLVLGGMNGLLQIRHMRNLSRKLVSKRTGAPIHTVAATHNGSYIFIGTGDGNILVICPK